MTNYTATARPAPGAARDAFDAAERALTPYQATILTSMRTGRPWLNVREQRRQQLKDFPSDLDAAVAALAAGGLVTAIV